MIHLDCFSYIDFSFWMGSLSFCSVLWDRFLPILCLYTAFSVWSVFSFLLPALTSSYSYVFILIHIKRVTLSPRCLSGGWWDRKYQGGKKQWSELGGAGSGIVSLTDSPHCFSCSSALCPREEGCSGQPTSYIKSIIPWRHVAKLAFWQRKCRS